MSDEPVVNPVPAGRPSSPEHPTGRNIPNEVEELLADMAALKERVATLETKVP